MFIISVKDLIVFEKILSSGFLKILVLQHQKFFLLTFLKILGAKNLVFLNCLGSGEDIGHKWRIQEKEGEGGMT